MVDPYSARLFATEALLRFEEASVLTWVRVGQLARVPMALVVWALRVALASALVFESFVCSLLSALFARNSNLDSAPYTPAVTSSHRLG